MNKKLQNINKMLNELYGLHEGLYDQVQYVTPYIKRYREQQKEAKRLDRLRRAGEGDLTNQGTDTVVGKSIDGFKKSIEPDKAVVKGAVASAGESSITDVFLATLGLPPGTGKLIAKGLNLAMDKAFDGKKPTPEQEKRELEKQMDKVRDKSGDSYYFSYVITKKDPVTKKEEPSELEATTEPIKAISDTDAEQQFKRYMDKKLKDENVVGAEYKVKDINNEKIELPPKKKYSVTLTVTLDTEEEVVIHLPNIVVRTKKEAEDRIDFMFKKYVDNSPNPDRFYHAKYKASTPQEVT